MRALLFSVALLAACAMPQEDPSTVKDLRVLGMQFEPPEVLLTGCNAGLLQSIAASSLDGGAPDLNALAPLLALAARPLTFTALIADPAGAGRMLDYRLRACASTGDRTCSNESDFIELSAGQTSAGELRLAANLVVNVSVEQGPDGGFLPVITPVALPDGTSLLLEVLQQDSVRGLGGIRVPVVLEVRAPGTDEIVYAQKLMPYVCQLFPEMTQNQQPVLPGVTAQSEPWGVDEVREFSGTAAITMQPDDFSSLLESYIVPSLALQPVVLTEAWKVAHFATMGTLSPYETGGVDLGGNLSRSTFEWQPDRSATEAQDVTFWFVVRDGRGGQSWLTRKARWAP